MPNKYRTELISVATIDTEGCTSPYSAPISLNFPQQKLEIPTFSVVGQKTTTCKGDSINLVTYANAETFWSNGAKGSSIWVKQSGDYSMYAVTANGCKWT